MDFYIKLTISIIGIGVPILMTVISNLDHKYNSQLILKEFQKEKITQTFVITLILAIISIILSTPFLSKNIKNTIDLYIYNEVISTLVIVFSILTLYYFFSLIHKTSAYYNPLKLHQYLSEKIAKRKVKKERESDIRSILHDLFFFSIDKNNTMLYNSSYSWILTDFINATNKLTDLQTNLDFIYYEFQSKLTMTSLVKYKNSSITNPDLVRLASTQELITGSSNSGLNISRETYSHIWNNINYMILEKATNFLESYYKSSYQSFLFKYDYSFGNRSNELSKEEEFYYFNIVVAAKIHHSNLEEVVNIIFTHTQSLPYSNNLLPLNMDEVFNLYYTTNHTLQNSQNSFFNSLNEGIGFQNQQKLITYTNDFIDLLFIRQWSLFDNYIYSDGLNIIPTNYDFERNKFLIRFLKSRKVKIVNLLKNSLVDRLNWRERINYKITVSYSPDTAIDNYIKEIEDCVKIQIDESEISLNNREAIINTTKKTVTKYLDNLLKISNTNSFKDKLILFEGYRRIEEKQPLTKNATSHLIDFDKHHVERIVDNINVILGNNFFARSVLRFKISPDNIAETFHLLNYEDYHLVTFGHIDLDLKLRKPKDIISFPYASEVVGNSIFFLKKSDFPKLDFKPIKENEEYYNFIDLHAPTQSQISIEDLNINIDLAEFINPDKVQELKSCYFIYIKLCILISWKQNLKITQIEIVPNHKNKGQLDSPKRIYLE